MALPPYEQVIWTQGTPAQRALLWRRMRRQRWLYVVLAVVMLAMGAGSGAVALAGFGPAGVALVPSVTLGWSVLMGWVAWRLWRRLDVEPSTFRWNQALGTYETWRAMPAGALVGAATAAVLAWAAPPSRPWSLAAMVAWLVVGGIGLRRHRAPEPEVPDEPAPPAVPDGAFARWIRAQPPRRRQMIRVAVLAVGLVVFAVVGAAVSSGGLSVENVVLRFVTFAPGVLLVVWIGNREDRRWTALRAVAIIGLLAGLGIVAVWVTQWPPRWGAPSEWILPVGAVSCFAASVAMWRLPARMRRRAEEMRAAGGALPDADR